MRTRMAAILATGGLVLSMSGTALAAPNPAGTGQPGVECGDDNALSAPPGFSTGGFAIAEAHYAGSEGTPSLLHANSEHAVSQYDVACFQYSQHH